MCTRSDTRNGHTKTLMTAPIADHTAKRTVLTAEPPSCQLPPLSGRTNTNPRSYKIDQTRPQKHAQQPRIKSTHHTRKDKLCPKVGGTAATVASCRTQ